MRPDRSYSRTLDLCCLVVSHSIPPTGGVAAPTPAVGYRRSLLTDLDTFFTKHHDCGDLDAGVNGDIVWMRCRCGANWPPEQTWERLGACARPLVAMLVPHSAPGCGSAREAPWLHCNLRLL
jgi:hypothetical protein